MCHIDISERLVRAFHARGTNAGISSHIRPSRILPAAFLLRVPFCGRRGISPVASWEQMDLPGLDRIKRAFALIHAGGVFPSVAEMVRWANDVRPAGEPEITERNIMTAEQFADSLNTGFRDGVAWQGG